MSFFSLDSKFSQIMGRVFDLMMLNIIFLIMCIPIVTIHGYVLRHSENDQK